jgi:alginate O-acetyltransferase complex protein AlgI
VGTAGALLGIYAFTLQIYFDFSGYTDLAIGCSNLLGFQLPENFRRPYASLSITDFWRRWHISLSSWLRDYLYIPLGGSRMRSSWGTSRNLMLTMLLGGLWHGAAWHFVLWGGLQGLLLVAERALGIGRDESRGIAGRSRALSRLATFHLVCLSWMLFRAPDNAKLLEIFRALARTQQPVEVTVGWLVAIGIICLGVAAQVVGEHRSLQDQFLRLPIPAQAGAYALVAVLATVLGSTASPFIYFQF